MIRLFLQALGRRASSLPTLRHERRFRFRSLAAVLSATAVLTLGRAQETNSPPLQYLNTPVLSQALETNLPALPPPVYMREAAPAPPLAGTRQVYTPSAVPLPAVPPLFRWGPLAFQSHLRYNFSYGDGLAATPGQQTKTAINELCPGMILQWGRHWTLDYTPILRFYSSSAFRDTLDHSVNLNGGTTYEEWTIGFSQSYISSSEPLIETGSQTDQQTLATRLSADYQISSQTSLELGLSQSLRLLDRSSAGEQLNNQNSWSTMNWLNHQVWPGFGAALGAGFGYDDNSSSSDILSEQVQGRITWQVVEKLSFMVSGGANCMQFLGSGASDLLSPVFSLSVQYSPSEATTLSVSAYNAVRPSYFQDQVTESTFISAGLHQRLLGKLHLNLSGGYGSSTYHASTTAPASSRSDYDTTSFSASLSASFLKRGSASVSYSVNYNSSGAASYDYTTSVIGFQLSYRY